MAKQTFTTGQVLTAAQMTSLQQTAMLGGAASAKTASYTLVAADAGTAISMSNASATTITVNTALFAAGDTVQITNLGAGVCTITAGTATVNTSASLALAQYESGTLDFTSTSAAIFIKGTGAAASGGMTLISTTTLTGASTVLSSIPQTYKHLLLILKDFRPSVNGEDSFLKLNNTAVTLQVVGAKRTGTTTAVFHRENEIQISSSQGNGFTTYETSAAIWFYLYTSTTGGKAISSCSAFIDFQGNTCAISLAGGHTANDTTAITSLGFNYGSGNIASGTALYME